MAGALHRGLPGLQVAAPFLTELAAELHARRDSRTGLSPAVYLTDDFALAADALGATARLAVGASAARPGAVRRMLTLCLPLASEGWHVLCEARDGQIAFGVVVLDGEGIRKRAQGGFSAPEQGVVCVRATGAGVEATGRDGSCTSISPPDELVPNGDQAIERLITAMTAAATHDTEAAKEHLAALFRKALAGPTGVIAAIVASSWSGGSPCDDAVILQEPIDLPRLATAQGSALSARYYDALAASMIRSDGIVVFDPAGCLRAYRWFVPFSCDGEQPPGGARERAFCALRNMVRDGKLEAAFIQSSDGFRGFASVGRSTRA